MSSEDIKSILEDEEALRYEEDIRCTSMPSIVSKVSTFLWGPLKSRASPVHSIWPKCPA